MMPERNTPTQQERRGEVDEATDQTGFLIVRFVTPDEYKAEGKMPDGKLGKPKLERVIDRLDDPDNILVLTGRSLLEVAAFPGPNDRDFEWVSELIVWAVQTRQLHDAITKRVEGTEERGDIEEMELLIASGIDVNIRDRWYV
jgi:hypothetical protein